MSSAWLPIRTVNLMGAPPYSWLHTISIGRSPAYFSFNNRLCYIIVIPWECQLKTVQKNAHTYLTNSSATAQGPMCAEQNSPGWPARAEGYPCACDHRMRPHTPKSVHIRFIHSMSRT